MASRDFPLHARLAATPPARHILLGLLIVHAISFVAFYPQAISTDDGSSYVTQARLMMRGASTEIIENPFTGVIQETGIVIHYPVGTAFLLMPWVAIGGWKLGFMCAALSVVIGTLLTGLMLRDEGYSPLFAGLVLSFPATLVMGRACTSETPSLMVVALGLWLFWRGLDRSRVPYWLSAGLVAGLSFSLREANALVFAPLFVGAVLRRDAKCWTLLAGGLVGLAVRMVAHQHFFDDALYMKPPGEFGPHFILQNLPIHGLALLVFVPGGLVAGLLYRGRRRAEIVTTTALVAAFHLAYEYTAVESGLAKRPILASRFFIPLLPILTLAMAEVVPRVFGRVIERFPARRVLLSRAASGVSVAWLVGTALAIVAIHAVHHDWGEDQAVIRDAIYSNTDEGAVLVTDVGSTNKFIDKIYGDRFPMEPRDMRKEHIAALLARPGHFYIVMLDRSDSAYWRRVAQKNADFVYGFKPTPVLEVDLQATPTDRLRIWKVTDSERARLR
jgi:hypothetical protein